MKDLKKTCAGCQHYDAEWGMCMIPARLWLEQYDPIGHITRDANRRMAPDADASECGTYRKRRMKG